MMTALSSRALGLAVLLAAVAGCDFTPALDIETPEYVPGIAIRSILVADSVALVRLSDSWDPYEGRDYRDFIAAQSAPAVVTLLRDGQPVEVLTRRGDVCEDYASPPSPIGPPTYPCGPYVGTVPVEAGGTYTLRVEPEALPVATATVTVPKRPQVVATEETGAADGPRRFRVRLTDRAGQGDLYGLSLLRMITYLETVECDETGCVETTRTSRGLTSFDTSDPVLLSAAAEIDGSITFVSFTDETFDGQEKAFTISADSRYGHEDLDRRQTLQVAALSGDIYDTYRIEYFSGGDDNPFAEPINLPSNVVGGYGLVGAVTLAEVTFEPRER